MGADVKHLFIGIDGTWRAAFADMFHSNVYRLNLALESRDKKQNPQIFIYSSGVGCFSKAFRTWFGTVGDGVDELILEAYVNVVSNYEPGDKIYIFGFSRGAAAARALSGLISKSGLLKAEASHLIEQAWRFFLGEEISVPLFFDSKNFHTEVSVEFVGVWDTVLGKLPLTTAQEDPFKRLRFRDHKLDKLVKHGVQILALDEARPEFEPILWHDCRKDQTLEQIWMPGVHTDIGGGYAEALISTVSLIAMLDKLKECCPALRFNADYISGPLFDSVEKEDVCIHNEQRALWGFGRESRQIDPIDSRRQFSHPIVGLLIGRDIYFKSARKRSCYQPSSPTRCAELPVASFRRGAISCDVVKILEQKFES